MRYPLENVKALELVRHPFEENDGDPGSRSYMRLLSLIIFAVYLFVQTFVPINYFLTQYYEQEVPLLMATLFSVVIFVALFSGYLITAALVRYVTSLYFLKYIRVNILLLIVFCTKKTSSKREKRHYGGRALNFLGGVKAYRRISNSECRVDAVWESDYTR